VNDNQDISFRTGPLPEYGQTALNWWKGKGGDDYTGRNRVDWMKRLPFWQAIVDDLAPKSVLEVGCNAGWNLLAIRAADRGLIQLRGTEPNTTARLEAQGVGLNVCAGWEWVFSSYDLVFTAGVLIHVPTPDLEPLMRQIVDASSRYVICIEYKAEEEQEVEYRGQAGLLWKRPYGKLYEAMGLKLLGEAHLPPESGFDNCHYWLLEKA
jgi:SAM-dependent methyltransferase